VYGQRVLAVGDLNGDHKPDIVTADQQKLVLAVPAGSPGEDAS
jgi:hypothetical protein